MSRRPTMLYAPPLIPPLNGVGGANVAAVLNLDNLWTNTALCDALFSRIDEFLFIDPEVGGAAKTGSLNYDTDWVAMLERLKAVLARHPHVKLIYDLGGPLGYSPGIGPVLGYGADSGPTGRSTPFIQGNYAAQIQLSGQLQPMLDMGFDIHAVEMQSSYGRLIRNGNAQKDPHPFYRGVGAGNANIRYTAVPIGTLGQNVRISHVVAGTSTALSVSVSALDVTVNVATDGAGAATSTANQVVAAVNAHVPAQTVVAASIVSGTGESVVATSSGFQSFYYGDDGVSYEPDEVGQAFAAWMDVIQAGTGISRFILNDGSGILYPWDGVAGYGSVAYPDDQPPEAPGALDEMYAEVLAGGHSFFSYVQDWSFEYSDRLINSLNEDAEASWYRRNFVMADFWRAKGVPVFINNNSLYGNWTLLQGSLSYLNTESLVEADLARKFQERCISGVTAQRAYYAANPSYGPVMDETFNHYTWFEGVPVILDNTASAVTTIPEYSFTDTFFKTKAISQPRRIDTQRRRRFGPIA